MSRLMTPLFLLVSLLLPATASLGAAEPAAKPPAAAAVEESLRPVDDVTGLPRVLLIGDSISMGYTAPVRKLLQGKANVHRPADNCSGTRYGLQKLDQWLAAGKWDVIHFNFGLHDAKLPPEGVRYSSPEDYERNLRDLVQRLRATGARLIWATTTPVPNGGYLAPNRRFGSIAQYNAIARKVMDDCRV
ncbi:MAG: SGNH/GDSL hydrolase family protein, partial [Thermoguttaceae bacterium]